MRRYVQSDLHVDNYCVQSTNYHILLPDFEDFYKRFMQPADELYLAGDVADTVIMQKFFLKFLQTKYKDIYYCFGNHDLAVKGRYLGDMNQNLTSSMKRINIIKDFFKDSSVHVLEGDIINGVAGCMGIGDCSFHVENTACEFAKHMWNCTSFDARIWNYKGNHYETLINYYQQMLTELVKQQPKVILTHYCPLQMGYNAKFTDNIKTSFYFFDAKNMLDMLDHDTLWICGHTHDAYQTEYINSQNKRIQIWCNPLGYEHEMQYELNQLDINDFYF